MGQRSGGLSLTHVCQCLKRGVEWVKIGRLLAVTLDWDGSTLTVVGLVQRQVFCSWSGAALNLGTMMSTIYELGWKDWQMVV
jgi:hypothetical protein